MSTTKKLIKSAQRLIRNILQIGKRLTKQVMNWLLRNLFVFRRHAHTSQAGFVLPTVIMVLLVVTLLTTAILFRSFDRAKNASNVRVNQATLSAAAPALDRAKAKIEMLLTDKRLPRGTPSDESFASVIENVNEEDDDRFNEFDLPGETRLKLTSQKGGNSETTTAWGFPVDTDNNGKYDSYTVYSLFYKSPIPDTNDPQPTRTDLQARTGPMTTGSINPACPGAEGTSASLLGGSWVNVAGTLKKSMFVYVATLPITEDATNTIPNYNSRNYEIYQKGNQGFSALELQADVASIPLSNNAVVYEDDVEIFGGSEFILNGRIFTNSNLFVTDLNSKGLTFRQVSSPASCYYTEENSKLVAGGHVGYGTISGISGSRGVNIHLFQGKNQDPKLGETLSTQNQSANETPAKMGYNSNAYEQRIEGLIDKAKRRQLPEVVEAAKQTFIEDGLDEAEATDKALDRYFRERTRRIPYAEVPYGQKDNSARVVGNGEDLRPSEELMYPYSPSDGRTPTSTNVILNFNGNKLYPAATEFETQEKEGTEEFIGDRVLLGNNLPELRYDDENDQWLGAEEPQDIANTVWNEPNEGPRQRKTRVITLADAGDTGRNGFWENAAAAQPKDKFDPTGGLRVVTGAGVYLPDLAPGETLGNDASRIVWPDWMPVISPIGATGFPSPASEVPYENEDAKPLFDIETDFPDVNNYDSLDSQGQGLTPLEIDFVANPPRPIRKRPFLRMRAAAVYHYTHEEGEKPIACVATYYDPTNWRTARNLGGGAGSQPLRGERDVSGDISLNDPNGVSGQPRTDNLGNGGSRSVNGITFQPPEIGSYPVIGYLRNQVYPNGRYVNPLLRKATTTSGDLKADSGPAEKAAYHSTLCALQIYGRLSDSPGLGSINPTDRPTGGYELPHGTIRETAFLDARQIKAVDQGQQGDILRPTDNYNLPIEQRYPLEVRATVLDLDALRQSEAPDSPHGDREYMLPNSGIIYATRDDALADASDIGDDEPLNNANLTRDDSKEKIAATDFLLDPTRRPNGIMLINGAKLYRERDFRQVEKGLIVASNLPVYIKAQPAEDGETLEGFNPHQNPSAQLQQEFTVQITPDSSDAQFYGRRENQLNKNFACRTGDPRLPECRVGDEWRPATVLSDSITLLSSSFREGFRNEGDYDLINHQIDTVNNFNEPPRITEELADPDGDNDADIFSNQTIEARRLWNGFWNNDFAINGLSSGIADANYFPPATDGYPAAPDDPLKDITPAAFPPGLGLTDDSYSTTTGAFGGVPGLPLNSSYFNNMVTPVQRRTDPVGNFAAPEYVMEYCPKTLVSECQPGDWIIGISGGGNTLLTDPVSGDFVKKAEVTSWHIFEAHYDTELDGMGEVQLKTDNDIPISEVLSDPINPATSLTTLIAGTTAQPPQLDALGKPRRVAFLRDPNGDLIFDSQTHPIPLGITTTGQVQPFPYNQVTAGNPLKYNNGGAPLPDIALINPAKTPAGLELCKTRDPVGRCIGAPNLSDNSGNQLPRNNVNALWYVTVNGNPNDVARKFFRMDFPLLYQGIADAQIQQTGGNNNKIYNEVVDGTLATVNASGNWLNGQPLLVPVLQLQATTGDQPTAPNGRHNNAGTVHWIPRATESPAPPDTTIFNLVLASKDSPSRPATGGHEGDIGGALHLMPRFLENWTTTGQAVQIDGSFIQIGRSFYATAPYYQLPNKNDLDNSLFGNLGYPPYYRSGNENKLPVYEAPARSFGFDVGLLSQIPDLFAQNFAVPPDEEPTLFYREVSRNDQWLKPLLCAKALNADGEEQGFVFPAKERPSCQ